MKFAILLLVAVMSVQALELPTLDLPSVVLPSIVLAEDSSVELSAKFIKNVSTAEVAYSTFGDQRNLDYSLGSEYLSDWTEVYEEYADIEPIEYVAPDSDMRMVAEVGLDDDIEGVCANLQKYKTKGFNAVLLSFDGSENVDQIVEFVKAIKSECERDLYCAFGGAESVKQTVFVDPVAYKALLEALAVECKGFLLGWRRTSLHLLLPDEQWTNFHLSTLRGANPNIIIFGEVYYGETANSSTYTISHNIPENISGVIVFNYGYDGINQEYLLSKYLPTKIPALKGVNTVGVVIAGNTQRIAERFLAGGSAGLITCTNNKLKPKSINDQSDMSD